MNKRLAAALLIPVAAALTLLRCGSGISDSSDALSPLPISVWVAGGGGRIHYSGDGGVTWAQQGNATVTVNLNAVSFKTVDIGIAVGEDAKILWTADGGATWNIPAVAPSGGTPSFSDISYTPSGDMLIGGSGGNWTTSADNGDTWSALDVVGGNIINIYSIAALTNSSWVAGGSLSIGTDGRYTTDSGSIWLASAMGFAPVNDISTKAGFAWAVGAGGAIGGTSDPSGGWVAMVSTVTDDLYTVDFIDANNGWAGGANGVVVRTSNAGVTWTLVSSPFKDVSITELSFVNSSTGFAVAVDGRVYRTTDAGQSWDFAIDLGDAPYSAMDAIAQ